MDMSETRERRLTSAFVTLADTMVIGYDVAELLQTLVDTCSELFNASAAGLLLADGEGTLSVIASTTEDDELVNLMQPPSGIGPIVDCYHSGVAVAVPDFLSLDQWPAFVADATAHGFRSAHVVPLRLRGQIIGALALFKADIGGLATQDASVVQGLADIATIGILHERAIRESSIAQAQLQRALDSRVIIEQAKGVIAQTRAVDMDDAFRALRDYARNRGLNLRDVAELVVKRSITI
jgi:GAF domain-containing protein